MEAAAIVRRREQRKSIRGEEDYRKLLGLPTPVVAPVPVPETD